MSKGGQRCPMFTSDLVEVSVSRRRQSSVLLPPQFVRCRYQIATLSSQYFEPLLLERVTSVTH